MAKILSLATPKYYLKFTRYAPAHSYALADAAKYKNIFFDRTNFEQHRH